MTPLIWRYMFIDAEIRLLRLSMLTVGINQKNKIIQLYQTILAWYALGSVILSRGKVCVPVYNNNLGIDASHVKMHLILSYLSLQPHQQQV